MRFPHIVLYDLGDKLTQRWRAHYQHLRDRPWNVEEGLWRRTQESANADQSGWQQPGDARRRMLHYRYRYGLLTSGSRLCLALTELYIYHSVAYPEAEWVAHRDSVAKALADGGWRRNGKSEWLRDAARCTVTDHHVHPQDVRAGRVLPAGYRVLDVCLTSDGHAPAFATVNLPWHVLAGGMRLKDQRQNPTLVSDLSTLADFLPCQVEVGCGMSVEAGIPPLHRLHEIYRVTNRADHTFVLDPGADTFLHELLATPEQKLPELTEMFRACLLAEPTAGHMALRELRDNGHVVGPVITNNFDGLAVRAGLGECFVRRYDQRVPPVPFLAEARSLLVIGSHADRRRAQRRARAHGMRVFFLDPEGFWEGERFVPYAVEGALDGDLLCRREAGSALTEFSALLGSAS